jgi:fumarylpyruvate hydrolase
LTSNQTSYAVALETPVLPVVGATALYPVRRIYCVGRNYVAHIREMKEGDERDLPFFFQKPSDSIILDGAELAYPPYTDDFQHEIELVVAIGKAGRDIPVDAALDYVFGYGIGIDMTRRDRQREARDRMLPWEMGKSFDESAPCGPIHPVAQTGHLTKGAIALSVNGKPRQTGDLNQMIWNVPEIISNLSTQYVLKPGDLIFSGTPAGVGAVQPGDRIEGTIEGLGAIHFTVAAKGK